MMALSDDTSLEILLLTRSLGLAIIVQHCLNILMPMRESVMYVKEAVDY